MVYKERAKRLRGSIRQVTMAPWFEEARGEMPASVPMAVFRDPRYSVLYRLYKNLSHPKDSFEISGFYQFRWKRTDKLYELWGFLQFIKALSAKDGKWKMALPLLKKGVNTACRPWNRGRKSK